MFDRLYRHGRLAGIGLAAALLSACGGGSATAPDTEPFYIEQEEEWSLVWSDEFDGTTVNAANWTFQEGDGSDIFGFPGWGNSEQQYYQADNATVGDGMLTITARSENVGGMPYTSSRMRSLNKFDFKFGRVEVRASAAPGQGLWSAVWMLPSDSTYGVWASSGETDILEVVNAGTENQDVFLAAHYGFEWPLNRIVGDTVELDDASEMHTYAIEWSQEYIRWFIDGEHLYTVGADHYYSYYFQNEEDGYTAKKGGAPFDVPFHLLVNLAVGGNGPGEVSPGDIPSEMVVDYIRVYQCQYGQADGAGCNSYADRTLDQPGPQNPYVYENELYNDGAATLSWTVAGELIERPLQAVVGWDNEGAMVVTEASIEGRGSVIDIATTGLGNAVINATDGGILDIYGHYGGGELKLDMYIDSSATAPLGTIDIKMDSGYPALGFVRLNVADLPTNEWFTRSIKISDFIENPGPQSLDIGKTMNVLVVEPSSAAHIMVDNVKLVCGHPERRGCGIAPPVADTGGQLLTVFGTDGVVNTAIFDKGDGATQGMCGSSADSAWADYCGDTGAAAGNLISWSLSDSGDPDVGMAALVNFGPGTDSGVFFFGSTAGADISDFQAEGFLRFDLKLPQVTVDTGMTWKLDCFYPCSTGDQALDLTGYVADTWQTFEFAVSDIANMGDFDLTRANTGLVLFPTFGQQNNLSFEVANVRFEVDGEDAGGSTGGGGEPEPELEAVVLSGGVASDPFVISAYDEQIGYGTCPEAPGDCPSLGWEVVSDEDRGSVLEVTHDASSNNAGLILAMDAMDMSDFADEGLISFDIKIVAANSNGMVAKVDCVYPCTSGDQALTLEAMGEWETITWNVSDLVASGLDLTTVNTGLVVIPAIGDQGGVVYRLDNVRWYIPGEDTGGTPPPALEDKVLEAGVAQAPFEISAYDEQIGYGTCPGAPGDCPSLGWEVVSDEDRGDVLEVTHDASSNNAGLILAVDPMDMSDYADEGKISFDIKIVGANTNGMLAKIDCVYPCTSGDQALTLDAMGEWETVTWNVSDLVASGLDLTTVNTGLVVIPAIGDQAGVVYRLDNVRWFVPGEETETPPPPAGPSVEDLVLEAGVAQAPFVISAYDEQIGYGTCPGAPGDCPSLGWEVVSDEDRGDVLEVTHDASSNNAGLILAVDPMDMSDYADAGKISFDIKIVGANTNGMLAKVDCVYPCTSGDQALTLDAMGEWETVTWNVSDLVASGLDLTTVNTGLVVIPAIGDQGGVVYRLDNVSWYIP